MAVLRAAAEEEVSVGAPSVGVGAVAGVLATLAFMVVHDLWILDIWNMAGPMTFIGALCGGALAWGYRATLGTHTQARWFAYLAFTVGLLVLLGLASFIALEPRHTFAEAMVMDDPLGTLLPPAVPLMVGAGLVGTALLWTAFGRRLRALVPLLFSHGLLVFFVGHNLAILGLVEFSSGVVMAFAEFAGLTVFLGGGFAASVWLAQLSAPRARDRA